MYFARYFISPARLASLIMVGLLSACAMVPPEPVVTGPVTAPPPPVEPPQALANGSIYQPTAYGNYPLFEDRRPRNIGRSEERREGKACEWTRAPAVIRK